VSLNVKHHVITSPAIQRGIYISRWRNSGTVAGERLLPLEVVAVRGRLVLRCSSRQRKRGNQNCRRVLYTRRMRLVLVRRVATNDLSLSSRGLGNLALEVNPRDRPCGITDDRAAWGSEVICPGLFRAM
jgi:hypothetical protein